MHICVPIEMSFLILTTSLLLMLIVPANGLHLSRSGTITALNGTQVSITCSLGVGSHDVRSIRWSGPAIEGDNVQIEYDVIEAGSTLHINNFDEGDEGRYTCTHNGLSASVRVRLNDIPYFGNVPLTQNFNEGDDARILCPAYLGDLAGTMIWLRGDNINPTDSRYVYNEEELNQALEIQSIQISDTGVYKCGILSEVYGSVFRDIIVNVHPSNPRAPNIDKSIPRYIFWYLDDLELPCNVVSGDQPITHEWSIDGIVQDDTSQTLRRNSTTYESGVYICTARNNDGADMFPIIIKINAPPLPEQYTLDKVTTEQGDTVVLRYLIPTTPVEVLQLNFQWSKLVGLEAAPVQLGSRIRQSSTGILTILDTQISDTGTYMVNISNEFGASVQTIQLAVIKPSPCTIGDVRLVGGNIFYEGRVEVCQDYVWRAVCGNQWTTWTTATTEIACRQAGFPFITGATIVRDHNFGESNKSAVLLYNINCDGSELILSDCAEFLDSDSLCTSADNVGIQCPICTTGDIRLTGGASEHEGKVEICSASRIWSTVCYNKWNKDIASVVCREAGYTFDEAEQVELQRTLAFQEQSLPRVLLCEGTEQKLNDCVDFSNIQFDGQRSFKDNCSIAGVRCQSMPHLQPIIIGTTSCSVVLVLLCILAIYPVWFLRKQVLKRKNHQGPVYEAVDELLPPPIPPIRAHHVRTVPNISYKLTFHNVHSDSNTSESSGICSNSGDCLPQNSVSMIACESASDCENDNQGSISDYEEELVESNILPDDNNSQQLQRNHLSSTGESPSLNQICSNHLTDEEGEHEARHVHVILIEHCSTTVEDHNEENDENVPQAQSSNDYEQIQGHELIGGYEAIGGYERAPNIDLSHCLSLTAPQNKHCDSEVADGQNTIATHDNSDERSIVSQAQDSIDYDQIQGYELIGGYEAIGGYERAPPIDIDHLSQCLPVSVPQNEHCNDNVDVTDCQNMIAIHDNISDRSKDVNQAQDSNDYDQIESYELIGGYEAIGGYERAPTIDIDHLSQFFSNQEQRQDPTNADDNDITESQNSRSIDDSNDQSCDNDCQGYDQIQTYELVPRLQDGDVANIIAEFGRHNQSEPNHNGGTSESLEMEELVERDDLKKRTANVSCDQN